MWMRKGHLWTLTVEIQTLDRRYSRHLPILQSQRGFVRFRCPLSALLLRRHFRPFLLVVFALPVALRVVVVHEMAPG